MKKVLHVIPGYGGGISSHVKNLVNGIDKERIVIDVVGFTDYPNEFIEIIEGKGGKALKIRNVRIKSLYRNILEFNKIIQDGKYNVVHLHLSDFQAFYFSCLAKINGVSRIIVHAHIAEQQGSKKLTSKILNIIKRKITVFSATDLASCSKLASEFRFGKKYVLEHKVMHIPNGVSEERLNNLLSDEKKEQYYNEFKIHENNFIIGNIGYLGYQKNHDFMLKLAKHMKKKGDKCYWLFVGTGIDEEKLKRKCDEMGLNDTIRFLGRREDVQYLYKIMDVTILPSHYEGLPTVTIESQAAGVATVISDTITDETDMGLNMIKRISLNNSLEDWREAIYEMKECNVPDDKKRFEAIRKMKFTTDTMASLYDKFIYERIKSYNIGEEVNG